ncbi:response regulator [Paenibacillus athensensis]|uniref:Two-component system, response regulator YesN n=1 Tax=Paenibacillus athensensis TaxID=1967502 RepID=A0A4Y8PV37_9BACL|nr:response regulator [Paenibacillus athensensis]MCD1261716.1 response regulator [Paenibacillus athensensis]
MNVLVVDDEPIIRLGLRTLVEWEEHGFCYAGEAEDGQEALELLEAQPIDIVITDLLMPRMDGLELIRRLKMSGKDVGIVVLSCMDDFTYVKEAMKHGAKDYLLKPTMEPETLLETLQGVRSELLARRAERGQVLRWQQHLASTQQSRLSARLAAYLRSGEGGAQLTAELFGGAAGAGARVAGGAEQRGEGDAGREARPGSEGGAAGLVTLLLYTGSALNASYQDWSWTASRAALPLGADRVLLLCEAAAAAGAAAPPSPAAGGEASSAADAAGSGGAAAQAQALAAAAERWLDRLGIADEPGWFVGAGLALRRLEDLPRALEAHERQVDERFYGEGRNRWMPALAEPPAEAESPLPVEGRNDLLRCIASDNVDGFLHHARQLGEQLRRLRCPRGKALAFAQELLGLAAGYARERGYAGLDDFEDAYVTSRRALQCHSAAELEALLEEAFAQLAEVRRVGGREPAVTAQNPFIRKAQQYMQEHYAANISTLDIADHVRLSRSYLSDLYSKETGESLSESLTRIRIEEAKRRLRAGELKIYEVAEAVGFPDAKVFAKTFKRVVGCSPKEFER